MYILRWTNAEVVSSWLSADKNMEIMAERDPRVRSILERGYNRSRLASKFNTLVALSEKNKLQLDTGHHLSCIPSYLSVIMCACM